MDMNAIVSKATLENSKFDQLPYRTALQHHKVRYDMNPHMFYSAQVNPMIRGITNIAAVLKPQNNNKTYACDIIFRSEFEIVEPHVLQFQTDERIKITNLHLPAL